MQNSSVFVFFISYLCYLLFKQTLLSPSYRSKEYFVVINYQHNAKQMLLRKNIKNGFLFFSDPSVSKQGLVM